MVIVARLGPFEEEETGIGAATGSDVVKVMGKGGRTATECMSVASEYVEYHASSDYM